MKYDVAIIGGGPAGYTAAETAGKAGLSVILFEKQSLGGVCLNEGCIPTKTLLYSAKIYDTAKGAAKYAVNIPEVGVDLPKIIARKNKVVRKLVLGVKAKLTAQQVALVTGEAYVVDAHTVRCGEETYSCTNLLLCTGSQTNIPPIEGLKNVDYWTHRQALDCTALPNSLVVIGGGVIGMEFASFFQSLGVKVTVVEMLGEILGGMDAETSALLRMEYAKRGVDFLLNTRVKRVSQDADEVVIEYENAQGNESLKAQRLLVCAGRRAVGDGWGLENLSLARTPENQIAVDVQMRTSLPNVFVCGDLTGYSLLAHTAVREAEVAIHTILGKADSMSYRAIPGVVYTNPEVAGVGYTEEALCANGIPYETIKIPMTYSGRFVAENEGVNGTCKLLISADHTILGAHVMGNPASEIIALVGMAIEMKLKTDELKKMIIPHPTVGEIFKEAL